MSNQRAFLRSPSTPSPHRPSLNSPQWGCRAPSRINILNFNIQPHLKIGLDKQVPEIPNVGAQVDENQGVHHGNLQELAASHKPQAGLREARLPAGWNILRTRGPTRKQVRIVVLLGNITLNFMWQIKRHFNSVPSLQGQRHWPNVERSLPSINHRQETHKTQDNRAGTHAPGPANSHYSNHGILRFPNCTSATFPRCLKFRPLCATPVLARSCFSCKAHLQNYDVGPTHVADFIKQ
ncbi:hypothetical protein RB213_015294 [Colletotrichum asianum]